MVRFQFNGKNYAVDFICSMGKDDADYMITPMGLNAGEKMRFRTRNKGDWAKGGIERAALAAYKRDQNKQFSDYCARIKINRGQGYRLVNRNEHPQTVGA